MIRKLNYTDRIKIKREDVVISLMTNNSENWFDADLSRLANYSLPAEGLVFLEAYRRTNWMRFDFGCIAELIPPRNSHLKLFNTPAGIKFRVKVTAPGNFHRLLAEADAIPLLTPEQENYDSSPLLDVEPSKELGDEIYKVDFSEGKPVLLINSEVGNYKLIGRSPAFLSLALPAIFREIMTKILIFDEWIDDNDTEDWHCRWIRFVKLLPGTDNIPDIHDMEQCLDWIQNTAGIFAKKHKLRMQFREFWRDEV